MRAIRPAGAIARGRRVAVALFVLVLAACAPRLTVLPGTDYSGALPKTDLMGHRVLNFKWQYSEGLGSTRGVGRISLAAPDSLRIDLELQAGQLSSYALLFGAGPFITPMDSSTIQMFPTPELVWAAVGRLAVPAARDTIKKIQEGVVRADIGSDPKWRATFDGSRLVGMEKAVNDRRVEHVTRAQDGAVTYVRGRSTLKMTEVKDTIATPFSPNIWRH